LSRITAVVGAEIAVVTGDPLVEATRAVRASVTLRTGVTIVTSIRVVRENTPCDRVAGVVCADVTVAASERSCARQTASVLTTITESAHVPVIAWSGVVDLHAALGRITAVVGTEIAVITGDPLVETTRAVPASVTLRAGVAIVTTIRVVRENTPCDRVAGVVCADVTVAAAERSCARQTASVLTTITEGADVAVIAWSGVVRRDTSRLWLTGVVGTRVPIIA
jgi:hypothetical protein